MLIPIPSSIRNPRQDDPGQRQHGAVRRTDPPAGDEGQEHRPGHRPPERPHLSPCALQEEWDHDRSRWDGEKNYSGFEMKWRSHTNQSPV